jgi:serine/threonine protein kinase
MTPDRWRQVTEIFHAARARGLAGRDAFLREACGQDASLRAEVDALLEVPDSGGLLVPSGLPGTTGLTEPTRHLQPGVMVGAYRVETLVGAGGMGEVYRATDTRLRRPVALKILAPDLSSSLDAHTRLQREAQLLAALNHPRIAQIYGIEDSGDVRALVMEFVEGRTLGEMLGRTASGGVALKVADALKFARQIAEALEAAHAQGIVHRDLKPANIKITPAGDVKVLDFGIATLANVTESGPTLEATREGAIIGTVAYMSPEQARGLAVDKRTDIWAFGCVLFEMLTRRRAFDAATSPDTVARILEREPDWAALPSGVPEGVRQVLRRCLRKDPEERLHDIADARLEIVDAVQAPVAAVDRRAASVETRGRWMWIALATLAVALFSTLWWSLGRAVDRTSPAAPVEFGIRLPDNHFPSNGVAVSPDGRYVAASVMSNSLQLWLHSLDSSDTRPLPGTEGGELPFWSPTSASIAFFVGDDLQKIDIATGQMTRVCAAPPGAGGGTWGTNGVIVFAAGQKLFTVPAVSGVPVRIPLSERIDPTFPQWLPDEHHVMYYASERGAGSIQVVSIDSGESKKIVDADAQGVFVPPHDLLFVRHTTLMVQSLDLEQFTLTGEPRAITSGVSNGVVYGPRALVSASLTGVLAFARPRGGTLGQLTWFERSGQSVGVVPQPTAGGEYLSPAISPTGNQIAVNLMDPRTGNWDIWVIDVARGVPERVTSDPAIETDPVWSPDGKAIIFGSLRDGHVGLYRKTVGGSNPEELLITLDDPEMVIPNDWWRDGKRPSATEYVIYTQFGGGPRSVWALPLAGSRTPIKLLEGRFAYAARVSPDGHWLAYTAFDSGLSEIYVQPFLVAGQKQQVSQGGGAHPRWTKDGHELVYWAVPGGVNAVDFESDGSSFRLGARRTLVQTPVLSLIDVRTHYDITPDGKRLLLRQPAGPQGAGIEVILNWAAKLKPR